MESPRIDVLERLGLILLEYVTSQSLTFPHRKLLYAATTATVRFHYSWIGPKLFAFPLCSQGCHESQSVHARSGSSVRHGIRL